MASTDSQRMSMAHDAGIPPVLLIGMHRSGTSLLARRLHALGLHMGWRLAANHEASFFNKLNSWLLSSSGGRWDVPAPIEHLLADGPARKLAVHYLAGRLAAPPAAEFLGPLRYLRYRSLFAFDQPWGFKDPRTTVTLPIWLELFPQARVLHVVRNGVDVAHSLVLRQHRGFEQGRGHFERHRALFRLLPKRGWFGTSPRLIRHSEAFRLWEEYLDFADRFTSGLDTRYYHLRYEDLLAEPQEVLARVATFCGLTPTVHDLDKACVDIRGGRAYAFRDHPSGLDLYEQTRTSQWMRRFGYQDLDL